MNRIYKKKILVTAITMGMVLSSIPMEVLAAKENTNKEEVVYVNLSDSGEVKEINVVNIFTPNGEEIVDYGDYSTVRNMTTTEALEYDGKQVRVQTSAEKLYYEGRLKKNSIPWNIEIGYYLNGKKTSFTDIQGKEGTLKITIRISENKAYKGDFFKDYALQTSLTLDTNLCSNIIAEGATIANVGSKKQLTYTILPGKGAEIEVKADVTDFEMEGISINGIPLNLNIEVDDAELMSKVTELLDAIEKIDDGNGELVDGIDTLQESVNRTLKSGTQNLDEGAEKLQSGTASLKNGGESVVSGAKALNNGATLLDDGITTLNAGIVQLQSGLDTLNEKSGNLTNGSSQIKSALVQLQTALNTVNISAEELQKLSGASSAIKTGIENITAGSVELQNKVNYQTFKVVMLGNGLDIDQLKNGNAEAIESINSLLGQVSAIETILKGMGISIDAIAPMEEQCISLANQIIVLLNGNNAAITGMESYLGALQQGFDELVIGTSQLNEKYAAFDTSIQTLTNTLSDMICNMAQLKTAVNRLVKNYEVLDDGLSEYANGVSQVVAGYQQIAKGAYSLTEGSSNLKNGSYTLYSGTGNLLNGISELYNATGTLKDGTGKLDEGVAEMLVGISVLADGGKELKDGTATLRTETSDMDGEIEDKIDELLSSFTGENSNLVSFVSEKNTNVDCVQFVIKTDSIQKAEEEERKAEEEKDPSFREKFLNLFK